MSYLDLTTAAIQRRNKPSRTHLYAERVTKRTWYASGGFRNPRCFRRQRKGGGWQYFYRHD
jgi:hypothetical protein